MIRSVRIENRLVGPGRPCFIVAEAGSNHDGSLAKALALIDRAAEAGADAVKFQLFRAERLYAPNAGRSDYLKRRQSIFDIIRSMELSPAWLGRLKERCRRRGIVFLASVFDEESAEMMAPLVPAFKIASYEMTHTPLVKYAASFGKPMLISCGASDRAEIGTAIAAIRASGVREIVLYQCTARYPAPEASLNLRTIPALSREFRVPVGYSDHSADPFTAPLAAVALGAVSIEKHFTLSRKSPGPDHPFSIEPGELAEMVRRIRGVESALGDGVKTVHPVERELHRFARRSIFTSRRVGAGEIFSAENLVILRNGKLSPGLPPSEWEGLLGRRSARPLPAHRGVRSTDVAREPAVEPIILRAARQADSRLIWKWRNDPAVVRNSLTGKKVSWSEHRRWFGSVLRDRARRLWIVEIPGGTPVAQVRADRGAGGRATLHVAVDRRHRAKGYGQAAIAAASHRARRQWGASRIEAQILPHNRSSMEAFRRAGFRKASLRDGIETWVWKAERVG